MNDSAYHSFEDVGRRINDVSGDIVRGPLFSVSVDHHPAFQSDCAS